MPAPTSGQSAVQASDKTASTSPAAAASAPTPQRPAIVLTDPALEIHRLALVFDGHNDLPDKLRDLAESSFEKLDISQPCPALHTDIPRLRAGGVGAQFWSAYVPSELAVKGGAARYALEQIDLIHRMAARYPDQFGMAFSADDINRVRAQGKIACLVGLEGGHAIENSLAVLRMFHSLGVRYITLTHGDTHDWCDSATDEPRHGGLSPFGEEVVREMNRLGILVDISHVSADAMRDVLRVSRAPVIASHSSAAAVADHPRNVPDDVLRGLRANGGVVMVKFYSGFVHPQAAAARREGYRVTRELRARFPDPAAYREAKDRWDREHPIPAGTVADVVDHIDHIVRVAGIDHVGLGSDFDGVGQLPAQLQDVSCYPYITQELLNRGYRSAEGEIEKILGWSALRALKGAETVAARLQQLGSTASTQPGSLLTDDPLGVRTRHRYDLDRLNRKVREIVHRHFRQATSHCLGERIHFEHDTRVFILHEPLKTGEWQDPWEQRGPNKGGILGDIEIRAGRWQGAAVVPQAFDKRYFTDLLMAPYSAKLDAHLYVHVKYPRDVPAGFVDELCALLNEFEFYVR